MKSLQTEALFSAKIQRQGATMTGKFFDELEVGMTFKHGGRTVTEMDNVLFSALTMNTQPLHVNEDSASKTEFGQRLVNGIFTFGLVVGLTVADLTEGTIIANLGYDKLNHPNPVFHGDTIYAESEIIEKRESKSRPNAGLVKIKCIGRKPNGTIVVEFERTAMFLKKTN
ncbi:MAG: MaoC family dehydratase [Anaerolineae bacterium]